MLAAKPKGQFCRPPQEAAKAWDAVVDDGWDYVDDVAAESDRVCKSCRPRDDNAEWCSVCWKRKRECRQNSIRCVVWCSVCGAEFAV